MTLETTTLACLSTAHVDEDTARELDALIQFPLPIAARDVSSIWPGGNRCRALAGLWMVRLGAIAEPCRHAPLAPRLSRTG